MWSPIYPKSALRLQVLTCTAALSSLQKRHHVRNCFCSAAFNKKGRGGFVAGVPSPAKCLVCSAEQRQNAKLMNSTLKTICTSPRAPRGATNYFYSFLLPSCFHLIKHKVAQSTAGLHVGAFRHLRPGSPACSAVLFMRITTSFQQYPAISPRWIAAVHLQAGSICQLLW